MKIFTRLLPLAIILTAALGAGIVDMVTEVIPFRPYTAVFQFTPIEQIGRSSSIMGDILIVTLALILVASLVAAVANRTTGIIISHTGGPVVNGNLTGSPGVSALIPLYPLFFAFLGLIAVAAHLRRQEAGV
jgi:hypothetical protein